MNALDLFCGAGGLSIGLEQAGINVVGAAEKTAVYAKTHALNFPQCATVTGDLSEISPQKFQSETGIRKQDVDMVAGGPPCQTFSSIGVSKIRSVTGKDIKSDPRNYLFRNYFDFVKHYQPRLFLLENVPNLRTKYGGKLFENMTRLAESLGYEVHIDVLNAVNFGVAQTRKRIFLVGVKKSLRFEFPAPTHRADSDLQLSLTEFDDGLLPPNTVGDALGDLPTIYDGIRAGSLPYSRSSGLSQYQDALRNENGHVGNNVCRVSNKRAKRVFIHMEQGSKYMDLPPEIRAILPFREDIFRDRLKKLVWNKPSWTVIAHIGMDGYMYIHPTENRTLSVREAARIQSFPDCFEFVGNMREQYIQVGNAVPPMLAFRLAESCVNSLAQSSVAKAV